MTDQTQNAQVNPEALTPEQKEAEAKRWTEEEFVKIQKYCLSQGVQPKRVIQGSSQCLPPALGIWYVSSTTKNEDYWVISGQLPTDLAPAKIAENGREAIRYFYMNWQLKAANIEGQIAEGKFVGETAQTQKAIADNLTQKAESLYQIYRNDQLWAEAGL